MKCLVGFTPRPIHLHNIQWKMELRYIQNLWICQEKCAHSTSITCIPLRIKSSGTYACSGEVPSINRDLKTKEIKANWRVFPAFRRYVYTVETASLNTPTTKIKVEWYSGSIRFDSRHVVVNFLLSQYLKTDHTHFILYPSQIFINSHPRIWLCKLRSWNSVVKQPENQ